MNFARGLAAVNKTSKYKGLTATRELAFLRFGVIISRVFAEENKRWFADVKYVGKWLFT